MCGGPWQGWGGDVLAERDRAPARKVPESLRVVKHSLCCVEGTKTRREDVGREVRYKVSARQRKSGVPEGLGMRTHDPIQMCLGDKQGGRPRRTYELSLQGWMGLTSLQNVGAELAQRLRVFTAHSAKGK